MFFTWLFFVEFTFAQINELSSLVYWFDDDVSGYKQKAFTETSVSLEETLDASELLNGFHRLNYRIQDTCGNWSQTVTSYFLKQANTDTSPNSLTTLQYWWDDDLENSIQKTYSDAAIASIDETGDTLHLEDGFHRLNCRFKDTRGNWSQTIEQIFIKVGDQYIEPENHFNNGKIYQVFDANITLREAEDLCVRLGGRLASVTQEADTEFLLAFLSDERYAHVNYFWLGGIDENGSARWEWLSGG